MRLNLILNYSPNFNLPKRSKKKINFIIIHYTGMKKEKSAINKLCNPKSDVSSHYFIKENGIVLNLVPDLYQAWHAGKSRWKNFKSLNKYSIGIEIHNPGHNKNYKNFSSKQINSLVYLLKHLMKIYKITYKNVLGHSDISPYRKKDPGEKFPWRQLAKKKLTFWHKLSEKKSYKFRRTEITPIEEKEFINNLYNLGYDKINKVKFNYNKKLLTTAFQRRFRQGLINGIIDKECLLISKSL